MRNLRQRIAIGAIAFIGLTAFGASSASAQVTFVDVPINQGGLFYRPSGWIAPRPRIVLAPAYAAAPSAYVVAAPAAPVYFAPARPRVFYPRPRLIQNRFYIPAY